MATINDYFEQSQFSLAAYALALQAGWSGGVSPNGTPSDYAVALMNNGKGMSETQAINFANTYTEKMGTEPDFDARKKAASEGMLNH